MNKDTIIISMTSFPPRIESSCQVWESVLNQHGIEQCHCVLVLAEEEFPNKEKSLPENLQDLIKNKLLEIIWHPTNIRSFKKSIPTILKYPENPVLTIDDDILRPDGWLDQYLTLHKKFPNDILAGSTAYWFDQNGILRRFKDKKGVACSTFSDTPNIIYNTARPSSGAGTLYPAHTFTDSRFFDEKLFMSLSPSSDETWAYCFNVIEDRTIRTIDNVIDLSAHFVEGSQQVEGALYKYNSKNYQLISDRLFDFFPEFKEKLIERSKRIIVSLTSFKERLVYVPQVIQTILSGTMLPSKIVLTLDRKDLPYITAELQSLIDSGVVELLISDLLIKPHTKYFLAMQKYRNYAVITIDDDIEYTPDLVESLYSAYMQHPNCICSRRCHRILWGSENKPLPYHKWQWQCKNFTEPRYDLFATGVGGVLYPPDILNIENSMIDNIRTCLDADDIYLKWLELNKRIKTVWVPNDDLVGYGNVQGTQEIALYKSNCIQNQNDVYLEKFALPYIPEPQNTWNDTVVNRGVIQPEIIECGIY